MISMLHLILTAKKISKKVFNMFEAFAAWDLVDPATQPMLKRKVGLLKQRTAILTDMMQSQKECIFILLKLMLRAKV